MGVPGPVPVLDKDRTSTGQGRLWIYRGDDLHPYTVYGYTPTRKRDEPVDVLGDYEGCLCADAYGGYDGIYPVLPLAMISLTMA